MPPSQAGEKLGRDLQAPDCLLLEPGYESSRKGSSSAGLGNWLHLTMMVGAQRGKQSIPNKGNKIRSQNLNPDAPRNRGFKDCPGFLNSTGRLGPKRGRKCPCILGGPQQREQNQKYTKV